MEENKEKKNPKLEEIVVVLSLPENTLSKIPLAGKVYSRILEKKYRKFFPGYKKIVLY